MIKISEDFSFQIGKNVSINETNKILKEYHSKFSDAQEFKLNIPIFLDTNILLNYYGMSKLNKSDLKKFFKDNLKFIHITKQIEKEFQRNRISTIQDYFDELDKIRHNFKTDLKEGIKNKFNNLLQSKIVEMDYPELMESFKKIYENLKNDLFENSELEELVNSKIATSKKEQSDLEYLDPILDIYKEFSITDELEEEEKKFLDLKYLQFSSEYKEQKESVKWKYSFPGCGEKKEKDLIGDFLIFHEIIKFMKVNNTDVIFLTRDVTKSDWLQKNRNQFIHYIENVYKLTGHLLFIFDATDLLSKISFENIYKIDVKEFGEKSDIHELYIKRYQLIVESVFKYFQKESPDKFIKLESRDYGGHDVDILIKKKDALEGILIYNCGSTYKNYKGNVQKRINACNTIVKKGILNKMTLVINFTKENFDDGFDYESKIKTEYPTKVLIGQTDFDNLEFIKTKEIHLL